MEDIAVTRFRSFLRIKSVQPNPDYDGIKLFLKEYATELGLGFSCTECIPGKPIIWLTLQGADTTLPSVLLNCHSDVVPVFPDQWLHDPFEAVKDENGRIYARGSQDMKCVGIQYAEAIRKLRARGDNFKRTIHLLFVPDEEIGGIDGMKMFIETEEFKSLNVGIAFDEGLASPSDVMRVFYGEKCVWWVDFIITGNPGHGSQFLPGTVGEKLAKLMSSMYEFRDKEEAKLLADPSLTLGDVVSCNVTKYSGGVQSNVVPDKVTITMDMRLPPNAAILEEMEKKLIEWCQQAGGGITTIFGHKQQVLGLTSTASTDPWWAALSTALEKSGVQYKAEIFPAGTDSRYLRDIGIPAYGFSPMNNTPVLLHDHNEYLDEGVFLRGVDVYVNIIPAIANVGKV